MNKYLGPVFVVLVSLLLSNVYARTAAVEPAGVESDTHAIPPSHCSKHEKPVITFGGYIRLETIDDSRQVIAERDGHHLNYPERCELGCNGTHDENAQPQGVLLPIQTRLWTKMGEVEVLCADTFGFIEGDFAGRSDDTINTFRLRHAYFTMKWEHPMFLFGQTWHPYFIEDCRAWTLSVSTGTPFDPATRFPQIRAVYRKDGWEGLLTFLGQLDRRSNGPDGFNSHYYRWAVLPEVFGGLAYRWGGPGCERVIGASAGHTIIQPRKINLLGCAADNEVASNSVQAYFGASAGKVRVNVKAVYAENPTENMMISGYAVATRNVINDQETYIPLRVATAWIDISPVDQERCIDPGIFAGFGKNLGTSCTLYERFFTGTPQLYTSTGFSGDDYIMDYVWRVAPRVRWHKEPVVFGAEIEVTGASYGSISSKAKAVSPVQVINFRLLLAAHYYF